MRSLREDQIGQQSHFIVERNTLRAGKVSDAARRIEIEIGDEKQDDFIPQFKTKHWDNEANLSVRLNEADFEADDIKLENGRVEWRKGTKTARLYELDGFEDGGFEFEVEFSEKPVSNVLEYTVQSKELDFLYQPPLTRKEIAEGVERPEHVVGSYAVYHKSKRDNRIGGKHYRTGKAFHIYRPWAEDANGERVWCDLNIDGNLMTVTVPQEFLDYAVYPVRVDPTFGYTSIGASSANLGHDGMSVNRHILPTDGHISHLTLYTAGVTAKGVLYNDSSSTPNGREGFTSSTSLSSGWDDLLFPSPIPLSSGDYWLGWKQSGTDHYQYDSTGGVRYFKAHTYSLDPPDPWPPVSGYLSCPLILYLKSLWATGACDAELFE